MSDGAKVAFADDSVLFGRRNGIEAKVVDKAVKVALYLVLRWLQAAYFLGSPLLSLTASVVAFVSLAATLSLEKFSSFFPSADFWSASP